MNKIFASVSVAVIATAMLAHAAISIAAQPDPCGGAVDKITVPASWQKIEKDGIVSYRAPSSAEQLTTVNYEITDSTGNRGSILRKLADALRRIESRLGGLGVSMSPMRQERHGSRLQTCWWGEDAASGRKFVSVARSWANVVHGAYYEAVGVSTGEFDQRAALIFGRSPAASPLAVESARSASLDGSNSAVSLQPLIELDGR